MTVKLAGPLKLAATRSDKPASDPRIKALRRFALSITALTIVGNTVLGFEQAYATPVVAVLAAYLVELLLETIDARANGRRPRYLGSVTQFADFLLPAHITGLACAMLLFANSQLWPVIFAVTVAVGSKYVIKVKINGKARHVLNPSNTGIALTLALFHWVSIAPPYQFTEWVSGPVDWIVPAVILTAGTMLNGKLTKKLPLIAGWVGGFAVQAFVRTAIEHTAVETPLLVMTGTAFVLFTNYMITDPGTTPFKPWRQVLFGLACAATYGLLVLLHVVFGLFFALVIVCAARGTAIALLNWRRRVKERVPAEADARAGTVSPEQQPDPDAERVGVPALPGAVWRR